MCRNFFDLLLSLSRDDSLATSTSREADRLDDEDSASRAELRRDESFSFVDLVSPSRVEPRSFL